MLHNVWRRWWDFGTAGLGDWGVHLFDVLMYAYPELTSPVAVLTNTPRAADWNHCSHCMSTLTYEVDSPRFKNKQFPIHYHDSGLAPSLRSFGVMEHVKDCTMIVCENGTMTLDPGGDLKIWQNGKKIDPKDLGANMNPDTSNHWHAWIDKALGKEDHGKVWTPLEQGIRMTEASILPVKASRFPNQELLWDRKSLTFTNNQEATDSVVRRIYRDGFEPERVG